MFGLSDRSVRLTGTAILLVAAAARATAQDPMLPDDPLRGVRVFEQKGCVKCHSVHGEGGSVASDLGKRQFQGGYLGLAQQMWNHFPQMVQIMREQRRTIPTFTGREMEDLFAYLYYAPYFGESGNAERGELLLTQKNCVKCHIATKRDRNSAPDLSQMAYFGSPVFLIRAMWNHGPRMQKQMREMGLKPPPLSGAEVIDIAAHLQRASSGGLRETAYFRPGNPRAGAVVFRTKHCADCHQEAPIAGPDALAPDLSRSGAEQTITEIAGTMWNHIEPMSKRMSKSGIPWPRLSTDEMADLIGYIYWLKFKDPPGDVRQGADVFSAKSCTNCHTSATQPNQPSKHPLPTLNSPITMMLLMWNHAPKMDSLLRATNLDWPNFSLPEMINLFNYLRQTASGDDGQ